MEDSTGDLEAQMVVGCDQKQTQRFVVRLQEPADLKCVELRVGYMEME